MSKYIKSLFISSLAILMAVMLPLVVLYIISISGVKDMGSEFNEAIYFLVVEIPIFLLIIVFSFMASSLLLKREVDLFQYPLVLFIISLVWEVDGFIIGIIEKKVHGDLLFFGIPYTFVFVAYFLLFYIFLRSGFFKRISYAYSILIFVILSITVHPLIILLS